MDNVMVGSAIKIKRVGKYMTQALLAKKCGLSRNYIAMIENDRKAPSLKTLSEIAEALGTTSAELLKHDPVMHKLREIVDEIGIDKLQDMIDFLRSGLD